MSIEAIADKKFQFSASAALRPLMLWWNGSNKSRSTQIEEKKLFSIPLSIVEKTKKRKAKRGYPISERENSSNVTRRDLRGSKREREGGNAKIAVVDGTVQSPEWVLSRFLTRQGKMVRLWKYQCFIRIITFCTGIFTKPCPVTYWDFHYRQTPHKDFGQEIN